jgi:TonB family protein
MSHTDQFVRAGVETHTRRVVSQVIYRRLHALLDEYRNEQSLGRNAFRIFLVVAGGLIGVPLAFLFVTSLLVPPAPVQRIELRSGLMETASTRYATRYKAHTNAFLFRQPALDAALYHPTTAATVRVELLANGIVQSTELVHSSGDASFDKAVTALLKRTTPFEPFYEGTRDRAEVFVFNWPVSMARNGTAFFCPDRL